MREPSQVDQALRRKWKAGVSGLKRSWHTGIPKAPSHRGIRRVRCVRRSEWNGSGLRLRVERKDGAERVVIQVVVIGDRDASVGKLGLEVESRGFRQRAHQWLPESAIGPDGPEAPIALVS